MVFGVSLCVSLPSVSCSVSLLPRLPVLSSAQYRQYGFGLPSAPLPWKRGESLFPLETESYYVALGGLEPAM